MTSTAKNPSDYIEQLPEDRKIAFEKLRQILLNFLPKDIEELMAYGMISYVIPHSIYPKGYHCDPKSPLPMISLANQKNFIAIYSMPLYFDDALFDWFVGEYPKHCKSKIDMGKSCLRLKKMEDIPFDLLAELAQKISVNDYITLYESKLKK